MSNFWTILAKTSKTEIFFKKEHGTFLSRLQALTSCKVSGKVMNIFQETASRTDRLMDRRDSIGLKRLRREIKKINLTFFSDIEKEIKHPCIRPVGQI